MMHYGFGRPIMAQLQFGTTGLIVTVIIWVLVIVGTIVVIRILANSHQTSLRSENRALAILKERYAKGELTKKEFEEMKKDIS